MMDVSVRVPVENQDDLLPVALADQAVQEVDEHGGHEFLLEHPEGQVALVGHRRDHVRAEPLAGALDHRGLPDRRPGSAGGVIGAQTHLIRPQDQGLFAVGTLFDRVVALIHQRATISGFCSNARLAGFCGLNSHARRYRPAVFSATRIPKRA